MKQLFTLYQFELRKLLSRRILWITLALGLGFHLLCATSNYFLESYDYYGHHISGKEYLRKQQTVGYGISGRSLDDTLFEQMRSDIRQGLQQEKDNIGYDEWRDATMAEWVGYGNLFYLLYQANQEIDEPMTMTAEQYYQSSRDNLQIVFRSDKLTEQECEYWYKKYDRVSKPFVYQYAKGYENTMTNSYILNWVLLLLVAASLSGIFADERILRTDALIFSALYGKKKLYVAKITAGLSVALGEAVVLFAANLGANLYCFGAEGANAVIQLLFPTSAWNITAGQGVAIMFGLFLLIALLYGMLTMFFSQVLKSSMATLAAMSGFLFVTLFNLPNSLGIIAKLWKLRPNGFIGSWTFTSYQLYYVFGKLFNMVQVAPVVYLLLSVALIALAGMSYRRYQVTGR